MILDLPAVAADIASLRRDAAQLAPTHVPPLPTAGPVAALADALARAVAVTNDQAARLQSETVRVAGNMEILAAGAAAIDSATGRRFEAMHS